MTVAAVAGEDFPGGEQWSIGLKADYGGFSFGLTYTTVSSDSEAIGDASTDDLLVGASYTFDAFSVPQEDLDGDSATIADFGIMMTF